MKIKIFPKVIKFKDRGTDIILYWSGSNGGYWTEDVQLASFYHGYSELPTSIDHPDNVSQGGELDFDTYFKKDGMYYYSEELVKSSHSCSVQSVMIKGELHFGCI